MEETIARSFARIRAYADPALFIALRDEADVMADAVAAGLVPLALGTDTAGSGRVPAGFNNIVGVKPSVGLVSNSGIVPACRSLDCVSVFALTTDDAFAALRVIAGADPRDPYTRARPLGRIGAPAPGTRIGVPRPGRRLFFGDHQPRTASWPGLG